MVFCIIDVMNIEGGYRPHAAGTGATVTSDRRTLSTSLLDPENVQIMSFQCERVQGLESVLDGVVLSMEKNAIFVFRETLLKRMGLLLIFTSGNNMTLVMLSYITNYLRMGDGLSVRRRIKHITKHTHYK